MNEGVKSISLDDIGESPKPIGLATTSEKALTNKTLQYTPQYSSPAPVDFKNFAGGTLGGGTAQGTKRRVVEKLTFTSAISRISDVIPANFSQPKQKMTAAILAGVVAVSALIFLAFGDQLEEFFAAGESSTPVVNEAAPVASEPVKPKLTKTKTGGKAGPEAAVTMAPGKTETTEVREIPGNPYWKLPNPVASVNDAPTPLSVQQTEAWRGGLSHPFNFQRYKATEAMRRAKIYGSVSILYEAIAQPKFWTRMEALLGIAEQGVAVDTESMRAAIGDARSDLVRNYFRRFRNNFGDGIEHVMRQALRVVDPKTRFLILSELAAHRSEANDVYLIAGTHDSDPKVKAFAKRVLDRRPPAAAAIQSYESAVSVAAVVVPKSSFPRTTPIDIQVEKIPANLNVEEVYFFTDDDEVSTVDVPVKDIEPKADDGFNDLNPTQSIHIETEKIK